MYTYNFNDNGMLETRNGSRIIRQYTFDENDNLSVQQIAKCDLAFFYQRHPNSFRHEIEHLFIKTVKNRTYSCQEVRRIFAHLGDISKADVQNAIPRIEEYHREHKERYKRAALAKYETPEQ